jgi:hypothetical protein
MDEQRVAYVSKEFNLRFDQRRLSDAQLWTSSQSELDDLANFVWTYAGHASDLTHNVSIYCVITNIRGQIPILSRVHLLFNLRHYMVICAETITP